MSKKLNIFVMGISLAAFSMAADAQPLPKSGTISVNSGWKAIGETVQIGEGRALGWGGLYGVTFNTRGSGPLHIGHGICSYTFELTAGAGPGRGGCSWSDADGDQIFTEYSGTWSAKGAFDGLNQITGGTGKFVGIGGKAPFQCKTLSGQGHFGCTQQFEYRLP